MTSLPAPGTLTIKGDFRKASRFFEKCCNLFQAYKLFVERAWYTGSGTADFKSLTNPWRSNDKQRCLSTFRLLH